MSKSGRVLKTHTICDNSHNKAGRQLQFTSEVTLIGIHIVSKFQPNPTIIAKVINNFVHSNFFQDFFQDHCVANCIEIKSYENFFQDHCILVYFQHNGRTAYIPTTHIPLALRGPADSISGVAESHHPHIGSIQYPPKDGMPASLVSWALKASSNGNISRYPKMMMQRNTLITCSRPLLTL